MFSNHTPDISNIPGDLGFLWLVFCLLKKKKINCLFSLLWLQGEFLKQFLSPHKDLLTACYPTVSLLPNITDLRENHMTFCLFPPSLRRASNFARRHLETFGNASNKTASGENSRDALFMLTALGAPEEFSAHLTVSKEKGSFLGWNKITRYFQTEI